MINTYNETELHRTLKEFYAHKNGGQTEKGISSYICDICSDKHIIEIQTTKLSALKAKLSALLDTYQITIVFPIAIKTVIETVNESGDIISRRKSPKKKNIFYVYRELTGIFPFLKHPNFCLEIPLIEQTEVRVKTDKPVQLVNKSRRWKKNWYKKDKRLDLIQETTVFLCADDYLKPLLELQLQNPHSFSVSELSKTAASKQSGIMLWVLHKMKLIFEIGKKGNKKLYSFFPPQA